MADQQTQPLKYGTQHVHAFLRRGGIQADVRLDSSDHLLIVMATTEFHKRRAWVETWFTLVEERGNYSYFRERMRGTGQTDTLGHSL